LKAKVTTTKSMLIYLAIIYRLLPRRQTTQWQKENRQKDNDLQNTTQTRTSIETGVNPGTHEG
jgi:hypothetical protein